MRETNLAAEYAKRLAEIGGVDETLTKFLVQLDVLEQVAYQLTLRSVEPVVSINLTPDVADALLKIVNDDLQSLRVLVYELGRRVAKSN